MTQQVVNGFPQFHSFTWKRSKFHGNAGTQLDQTKTDIDIQSGTIGDSIQVDVDTLPLLTVQRDGAFLHPDQGYELVSANTIRVVPGLLDGETVEFLFFTGVSGVLDYIPVAPTVPGVDGYDQTLSEAIVFTDNSQLPINAYAPSLTLGKTRITTHFEIDAGRIDVYINGGRAGIHSGIWTFIDANTIELNDDFSSLATKVEIVKQIVGL